MMPAFITDGTSVRTLALSAAACAGDAQYGHCATLITRAIAIFAPQSAKAPVTPHGLPEIASVTMFTTASAAPPATSGHGPCSARRQPRCDADTSRNCPYRRRSRITVAAVSSAKAARLTASPGAAPSIAISESGFVAGRADHHGMCAVPMTEPAMKAASVASIRVLPPPAEYKVPEAQPPPSCIPTPKRNAPTTPEMPTGDTEPRSGWPNACPFARSGKNTAQVSASISICARIPLPRRSVMKVRHDAVNPNAAWYRATPATAPTRNNGDGRRVTAALG